MCLSFQAAQETEIQRIKVLGQPRPKQNKTKFLKPHLNGIKLGMVVYACHPRDGGRSLK
jgi:hypothetical protein